MKNRRKQEREISKPKEKTKKGNEKEKQKKPRKEKEKQGPPKRKEKYCCHKKSSNKLSLFPFGFGYFLKTALSCL